MARPLRPEIHGGLYHLMARGNERQDIFRDDIDRQRFLAYLRAVTERQGVLCHSYCLMPNHYHLLLETPAGNISLAIRNLNGTYAQAFNRRHDRVGHLFQGRFFSRLVEKDTYLKVVARYIVLNPVRAGLVRQPSDWVWSSYRALAGMSPPQSFLNTDWLLDCFGAVDPPSARVAYRSFVRNGMKIATESLGKGPILGSDRFIEEFRDELKKVANEHQIPRAQRFLARPTLEQMFEGCGDRAARNARIRKAHIDHGYTMTSIACHLGLHLMTISRAVREKC